MGNPARLRASLPMYDLPEARAATEAWWRGVAAWMSRCGIEAPASLEHGPRAEALWQSPHLFMSQTCGYPLVHRYHDGLRPLATPVYAVPGCRGARYCSLLVVREDDGASRCEDLRGAPLLVNREDSWSGWHALRRHVRARAGSPQRFFGPRHLSGAHRDSLAGVRQGRARYCSVDTVTYHLLQRHAPRAVAGLRILEFTARAPALPYVAPRCLARGAVARMREALARAAQDPALAGCREALYLRGFSVLGMARYREHMGGRGF